MTALFTVGSLILFVVPSFVMASVVYTHSCQNSFSAFWCPTDSSYFSISPDTDVQTATISLSSSVGQSDLQIKIVQQSVGTVCTSDAQAVSVSGEQHFFHFSGCSLVSGTNYYITPANQTGGSTILSLSDVILDSDVVVSDTSTRVISTTPLNGEVIATSTTNFIGASGYVNSSDTNSGTRVVVNLTRPSDQYEVSQCASVICSQSPLIFSRSFVYSVGDGAFDLSSSTLGLSVGQYLLSVVIQKGTTCLFGYCVFETTQVATSTLFTVATSSPADVYAQRQINILNSVVGVASTTDFSACGIAQLDLLRCGSDLISYAFVPTSDGISSNVQILHDDVLTHFPLGYVTDAVQILSTSTVGTLVVFDAHVPSPLPGAGTELKLDFTHGLDQFLNATTGEFISPEASTTQTLFEATNGYWSDFVYLATFLYILARIFGSHVIPSLL